MRLEPQDMRIFSENCIRAGTLSRLRSITLTVDDHTSLAEWQQHVLNLLSSAPLQQFHISTIGGHVGHRLSNDFCSAIVSAHGSRLTRFSVHRMRMSINAIADICRRCIVLQQLFIVVDQNDMVWSSVSSCAIEMSDKRITCAGRTGTLFRPSAEATRGPRQQAT